VSVQCKLQVLALPCLRWSRQLRTEGCHFNSPSSRGYISVTVGGGPVEVPLPIGGNSAYTQAGAFADDRTVPSLFSETEGGWEEGGTRVTARLSVVAGAAAPVAVCKGSCPGALWHLCCGDVVGGAFAGGRPSVFHRSLSLLVRWDTACGRSVAWASSGWGLLQQACGFTAV
jgi:hypothetical protein